eukprot:5857088-Amphidinium_carterae.1
MKTSVQSATSMVLSSLKGGLCLDRSFTFSLVLVDMVRGLARGECNHRRLLQGNAMPTVWTKGCRWCGWETENTKHQVKSAKH